MTRIEREEMIERYVQGIMPSSEEERFLIEVASDPELRYELKASQVIDSAIRKDRGRGMISTGKMRANIALLAAPLNPAPAVLRDSGIMSPGNWFSRWTAGAAGVVALVIGALFVAGDPLQNSDDLPVSAEQVISIQEEDLLPAPDVTDVTESISADVVLAEPNDRPRQNVEPQSRRGRTVRTPAAVSSSVQEQSAPAENEQPIAPDVAPPTSQQPISPEPPPIASDRDTSSVIDKGVDASDTTNSGSPSMNVDIDSIIPPN